MRNNITFEKVDVPVVNHVVPISSVTELPVSGLVLADFTVRLFNPETGEIVSKLHDPRSGQVIEEVVGVDVLNIDLDEEENPIPAKVVVKAEKSVTLND